MGFISQLVTAEPVASYPFIPVALARATLWLWLQYEQTRTALVCLRRARIVETQVGQSQRSAECEHQLVDKSEPSKSQHPTMQSSSSITNDARRRANRLAPIASDFVARIAVAEPPSMEAAWKPDRARTGLGRPTD
jgi:hypothetical protein